MFSRLLTAVALAAPCLTATLQPAAVASAFDSSKLVPDVVSQFNPTGVLTVIFDNSTTNVSVTPGMNVPVSAVTFAPQVSLTSNDSSLANETFVIAMVDPDAPTPQNASVAEVRHFLAGGFTLSSGSLSTSGAALTNSTPALSPYITPAPPAGSDPHRYTILLFVQPANFSSVATPLINVSNPLGFNISAFAAQTGLGSPVAGTFFLTGPANGSASTSASGSGASAAGAPSGAERPVLGAWAAFGAVLASLATVVF